MKNPIRTEAEAFSFVIVCAVVFLVVALAGALLGGWVALAVFAALAVGAFIGIYMKSEPKVREPAVWDRRPRSEDGARRKALRPLPGVMVGATSAMVAVTVALTALAGPLYAITDQAADDLLDRAPYIAAVLDAEGGQ